MRRPEEEYNDPTREAAASGSADPLAPAIRPPSQTQRTDAERMARRLLLIAAAAGTVAVGVFLFAPGIDLWISALFFDGSGHFVGRRQVLVERAREAVTLAPYAVAGLCLAGLLISRLRRAAWLTLRFSQWLFLAICLAAGPGLITNVVLKDHWGRARPAQIVEYGGQKTFSPPLIPTDQCRKNCSFVSAEASLIFMIFYAAALILPHRFALLFVAGTLGGLAVGAMRISQGAHFLSDVVFAGLFMAFTAAIVHGLMFGSLLAGRRA